MLIYNMNNRQTTDHKMTGVCAFMSFDRLVKSLRETGEFSDNEKIRQIQIDERGLTFVIEYSK